jgi:hypothetical protein
MDKPQSCWVDMDEPYLRHLTNPTTSGWLAPQRKRAEPGEAGMSGGAHVTGPIASKGMFFANSRDVTPDPPFVKRGLWLIDW